MQTAEKWSFALPNAVSGLRSNHSCVSFTTDGAVVLEVWSFEMEKIAKIQTGGEIFDHQFYPGVSEFPAVLVSSRRRPLQLINVANGGVLSAYTAYSCTEEIVHALSVAWSPACVSLAGGFGKSTIRVWDVQRPGRQIRDLQTSPGIVGAVAYVNENTLVAGTYSGNLGLLDVREKGKNCSIGATEKQGGIVQLQTMGDMIVSGHRKDKFVRLWDMRSPDSPLMLLPRVVKSFQRFQFSIIGDDILLSGDHDGVLTGYDLKNNGDIVMQEKLVSAPLVVLASCGQTLAAGSGQRSFPTTGSSSESSPTDRFTAKLGVYTIS